MTLSSKEITSLDKRLHFTAPLLKSLLASSKLQSDLPAFSNLKPSQCVERFDKFPLQAIFAVSPPPHAENRSGRLKNTL